MPPPSVRYISAFFERGPGASHASTQGIHIEVASLPLPQGSPPPSHWAWPIPRPSSSSTTSHPPLPTPTTPPTQPYAQRAAQLWPALRAPTGSPAPPPVPGEEVYSRPQVVAYRIRMWREGGAPSAGVGDGELEGGPVVLTRREWFSQAEGEEAVERIEGPGVIGLYPELARGGRTFAYCSRTAVPTNRRGYMWGKLYFRQGDKPEFPVAVAKWIMGGPELPPFLYF